MKTIIIIMLLNLLNLNLFAKSTVIEDQKCLDVPSDAVGKSLLNYNEYKDVDNQIKFDIDFLGVQLKFIDMIKSEPYILMNNSEVSKSIVQFVFQALNIKDAKLLPHFHLLCLTNSKTPGRFAQKCEMIQSYESNGKVTMLPRFAMKNFNSLIVAQENSTTCGGKKTLLSYKVNIDTEDSEVYKIKEAVSMGYSPLTTIIDKIFDESSFFKSYYINFYDQWIKQL